MSARNSRWDFFLAHAGPDTAPAEVLYDLLVNSSRVFLDSRCLQLGDEWDAKLAQAQQDARVSVVLISSNVTKAYYQREEIAAAIALARSDEERHRVVPIYLPNTDKDTTTIPYGLRLKHGLSLNAEGELSLAAEALLRLLKTLDGVQPSGSEGQSVSKQSILDQQLAKLSANCTKAQALEIEARVFELLRDDVGLLLVNADQFVAPAREAIAVVAGRILHANRDEKKLVELLRRYAEDPDKWVRKKAKDGLMLCGYHQT